MENLGQPDVAIEKNDNETAVLGECLVYEYVVPCLGDRCCLWWRNIAVTRSCVDTTSHVWC